MRRWPLRWNLYLWASGLWKRHRVFSIALAAAIVPRVIAMLGFRPAILIQDSFGYLQEGVHLTPGAIRPAGYPVLLRVLVPFHSLGLVTGLQHLAGLGVATLVYALLRYRGLPGWGATLAAAPTLFDPREIWIEQSILADTLFTVQVVAAIVLLLPRRKPAVWQVALSGLLLAWATITRGNGFPLILAVLGYLIIRRVGWRALAAGAAAFAVPVLGYMLAFYSSYHEFALTSTEGVFLWSRTMSFADCAVIKPPPNLLPLCRERQPDAQLTPAPAWSWLFATHERKPSSYLWDQGGWWAPTSNRAFNAGNDGLAKDFALRAIAAQPLDYVRVTARDVAFTFLLTDRSYQFTPEPHIPVLAPYMITHLNRYAHTTSNTRAVQPWAFFMFAYQSGVFFPGVAFGLVVLGGFGGLIWRWRRLRDGDPAGFLPWAAAVLVIVVPVLLHEYDYRYAIPAVPLSCMAAALAFAPPRAAGDPRRPAASLAGEAIGAGGARTADVGKADARKAGDAATPVS